MEVGMVSLLKELRASASLKAHLMLHVRYIVVFLKLTDMDQRSSTSGSRRSSAAV